MSVRHWLLGAAVAVTLGYMASPALAQEGENPPEASPVLSNTVHRDSRGIENRRELRRDMPRPDRKHRQRGDLKRSDRADPKGLEERPRRERDDMSMRDMRELRRKCAEEKDQESCDAVEKFMGRLDRARGEHEMRRGEDDGKPHRSRERHHERSRSGHERLGAGAPPKE